jgi:ATP phosphoribosyltransferase
MMVLLAVGRIDFAVTYETVSKNFPKVYTTLVEVVDPTIALALIERTEKPIDITKWTESNRALIAAEHVWHVAEYFRTKGVCSSKFHLDRITGSSESFLVNTDNYDLCDAVVETGKTLDENGLRVFDIIIPKGSIHIGLYRTLVTKK